jgi:hypothetical protein
LPGRRAPRSKPSKRMLGDKAYDSVSCAKTCTSRDQAGHSKSLQQKTTIQL